MKVSVVLASYNGASTLPLTLGALERLNHQDFELELVLVDNASTDSTAALLKTFAARTGALYVHEPAAGRSNALNAGVRHASGDLLVFTDDDVIPDPNWIAAYVQAARQNPDIVAFAGQIRLHWPKPPTRWLAELERLGRTLGATPMNRPSGFVVASDVKGANSAVRAAAFGLAGGFRKDLGVSSSGPVLAGEETAFFGALQAAGHKIFFSADACLLHVVRPHQMSLRSLMQRGFRNGRGAAQIEAQALPASRVKLFGLPGYAFLNLAKPCLAALRSLAAGHTTVAVCDLLRTTEMAGFYWGKSRSHSRSRPAAE